MITTIFLFLVTLLLLAMCFFALYSVIVLFWTKVPYVPTDRSIARKMIEVAEPQSHQNIYDLGCGDGKLLFMTERHLNSQEQKINGKLRGFELIRPLVWLARFRNFLRLGKCEFEARNFFHQDLSDADLIYIYLWPSVMDRFYKEKFHTLKPGCRLISHAFLMEAADPVEIIPFNKTKIYVYKKK